MSETRTRPPEQASGAATEEEIAFAIALILAGEAPLPQGVDPAVAVAAVLRLLPSLPALDDDVSTPVARLVVRAIPQQASPERPASLAETRASRANLSYRAHYAIEADKRLAKKVLSGESVTDAFKGERRHFRAHLEASLDRVAGARMNDAAVERWGNILSWIDTGRAHTHRPSHLAADGANYDVRRPPVATDGMLPGQAPHCDCVPGPPKRSARMLR